MPIVPQLAGADLVHGADGMVMSRLDYERSLANYADPGDSSVSIKVVQPKRLIELDNCTY